MKVSFVGPEAWETVLTSRSKARSGGGDPALPTAILRMAQSSGLGIPPEICFSFAAWLSNTLQGDTFWKHEWQGLFRGVDLAQFNLTVERIEVALKREAYDAVRLCLVPLAKEALSSLGEMFFFASNGPKGEKEYSAFTLKFEDKIRQILRDDRQSYYARWTVARLAIAMRIIQYVRAPDEAAIDEAETDVDGVSLFLAAALHGKDISRPAATPVSQFGGSVRSPSRRQMDGVEGIRQARPSEDLSQMVPSQFAIPKQILAEKIANEGFVAFSRPPPTPQAYNLLFVCCVLDLFEGTDLSMVRAAWWRAASLVEPELYTHLGQVDWGWLPLNTADITPDTVRRKTVPTKRMTPKQRAHSYLGLFPEYGAPFLAGRRGLLGAQRNIAAQWPDGPSDALDIAGLLPPIEAIGARLGLFSLTVGQDVDGVPGANWRDDLEALAPNTRLSFHLRKVSSTQTSPAQWELDGQARFPISDDFEEQTAQVIQMARHFADAMRNVALDG